MADEIDWRKHYQLERVNMGYVLGWLDPKSEATLEEKHAYISHMNTAQAVAVRLSDAVQVNKRLVKALEHVQDLLDDGHWEAAYQYAHDVLEGKE